MAERKNNFNNEALSDVEKFLLLLSDLQIIDSGNSKRSISDLPSISVDIESDIKRSPVVDPFPSLLDELPFLRDFKPFNQDEFEQDKFDKFDKNLQRDIDIVTEDVSISNNLEYLPLEKAKYQQDQLEAINL